MPTVSTPAALPSFIEDLLEERQSYVDAIAGIDAKVSGVFHALGIADVTSGLVKPESVKPVAAKPAAAKPVAVKPVAAPKAAAPKAAAGPGRKRGAVSKFGISANDFVLAYVGAHKGATTQDINNHWKSSGRPGTADNSMSILTRSKKLKRAKVAGGRGSKYTLA